ncbi:MAG TPA: MarR family transcriptional regulator [Polyangiaceae bacterium]|jgi:DNA-binding MarR family transcriptional regulator|nr:MarR family transcriptional regulator [Polyangiaceae bacterium]
MARAPHNQASELAEVATALYQLVESLRAEHEDAAASAGLTAPQAMILMLIDAPTSMRQFAERMGCDASNITGIVDRLEAKGLVVRSVDPSDRRVKRIARTPAGDAAVGRFQKELVRASSLAQLSPKARKALLTALAELRKAGPA